MSYAKDKQAGLGAYLLFGLEVDMVHFALENTYLRRERGMSITERV